MENDNFKAFSLCAASTGAFKDAVVLGQGLPQNVGGQPVRYFWKEVIRAGSYTHPQTGQSLAVTTGRMDRWIANFRRMRQRGVKVYVPVNHSRKTEDNRGYVVDARRRGERLELLHQLIGEDAARDAARSEVSLRIVPDFKDGLGNVYDEAIEHSSLVVDPVVPGQGEFESAEADLAASRTAEFDRLSRAGAGGPLYVLAQESLQKDPKTKGAVMNTTPQQVAAIQEIRGLLGDPMGDQSAAAVTEDNALEAAVALARELHGKWEKSRLAEEAARTALEEKEKQLANLSRQEAEPVDGRTLMLLGRSLASEREAAVAGGGVSPATAKELEELLSDGGKPNVIALSRADEAGEPLAFRVWSILRRNKPAELGQRTGVQTLNRVLPPDEPARTQEKLPYEDMAARYNQRAGQ